MESDCSKDDDETIWHGLGFCSIAIRQLSLPETLAFEKDLGTVGFFDMVAERKNCPE